MKSIIQKDREHCFVCGENGGYWGLDRHHVFFGANRNKSEKYGLYAFICHDRCHLNGVHKNHKIDLALKRYAQQKAMEYYGWSIEDFRKVFGKNYI